MITSPVVSRTSPANAGAVRLRAGRPAGRERGAVLVHVAVAMMGLLAFSALSIDLGTLWVARGQAQNAADAAAHAGAISLAYGDPTDADAAGAAAESVVREHSVWGEVVGPASVRMQVGPCPTGAPALPGECVRVVVERTGASGSPLPVFFSRLFGAGSMDLSASASAKVMLGNSTPCPRPLAIVDRWDDRTDTTAPIDAVWSADDTFQRYDATGNLSPAFPNPDVYVPADVGGPGLGWALAHVQPSVLLTFTLINPALPVPLSGDNMISLDFPRAGGDPDAVYRYEENLGSCGGMQLALGQTVPSLFPHRGSYTMNPLDGLVAADPSARWDDGAQVIRGSAFDVSPRLITIAVIDPDHFSQQNRTGGADPTVLVRNLVGFFVEGTSDSGGNVLVRGRLVRTSGQFSSSAPVITDEATFLRNVALVR